MAIRIQGETYEDEAELVDTIGKLTAEAFAMPQGKARTELTEHISRLESALSPSSDASADEPGDAEPEPARGSPVPVEPPPAELTEEEYAVLELGAELLCPMCKGEGHLEFEPPEDPDSEQCPSCNGWGKVYTGSLVPGYAVERCARCKGEGRIKSTESAPYVAPEALKAADVPEQLGATWDSANDRWLPPEGQQPPLPGATWDTFYGKWVYNA